MLSVTVMAVGGIKEKYLRDACGEYLKRLGAYCKPSVVEISEHRLPKDPSPGEVARALEAEGESILRRIPVGAYLIALCIEGEMLSSEELAAELAEATHRYSKMVFVIGGSHGLSDQTKKMAHRKLSMSRMTFPHQMARILLLEQLYRGFSIAAGGKYHK